MALSTLSLLSLPPELVLKIADHLPPDGILALKFSHRILNYSLPLAPRLRKGTLTRCARLAVRSYLVKPTPSPTHLRCILCKSVYPLKSFQSSSSPACAPLSFAVDVEETEVVELPQRLCAWHVGLVGINGSTARKICVCIVVLSNLGRNVIANATAARSEQ
ncbi:uncharacterized protein M421DRAFT_101828 [Didymella exigua CBS 183.55]|uniref:F-box domain-containing protein n=1 Tax=Didymella exigua CBS 183.55 TaxID=1150837 RepID=A0A6A5RPJ0_9PLEO|nr:uncharacterized protein M421DRAFT_101828 [Didymella exigua CBS 183.55]KAF1927427.1 hypothetical protein M421DRAFT_101828 [Didymella exigua CBS 183.55]